jgi:hypothetical protein
MAKRSRQAASSQSLLTVDQAFQLVLNQFGTRQIAVQRLKELVLWGCKESRWFETDMDRYGMYVHVYQTPDGWLAEAQMQPGRIGIADFAAYRWAFAANEVKALCKLGGKAETPPGARRGRKVKYDWSIFEAEFYCRLYRDDVGQHDEINVEARAKDLMTWGEHSKDIGEENTPEPTAMREKVSEWVATWRRKPTTTK